MGQQTLIYSFVARGTMILAEYTEFTGNLTGIAAQCPQKLPPTNNKFTYNCDGHTFNYLVEDGFIGASEPCYYRLLYAWNDGLSFTQENKAYCFVAVESAGRQIPIAFLKRTKEGFTKKYRGGKPATAVANSLKREAQTEGANAVLCRLSRGGQQAC